jgi:hypothetical protein
MPPYSSAHFQQEVTMDWFERITGFREGDYESTQARLSIEDGKLVSTASSRRWDVGTLETPTLAELRQRTAALMDCGEPTRFTCVQGDVRGLHREVANSGALFQVASQFNLLEMTGPSITPEHGVTRYDSDPTQGPACAIAAGAATIYRNYFVPVQGQLGQRANRQIDCLHDMGAALGNDGERLWAMRNGYALCTSEGLAAIDAHLGTLDEAEREHLKGLLRVGMHWGVEVTDGASGHRVSQAFCSALPVGYTRIEPRRWARFAALVLQGAYEATLLAAVLHRQAGRRLPVYLTALGGGAFGNDRQWIIDAMRHALFRVKDAGVDVRIVGRSSVPAEYRGWQWPFV